MRCAIIISRVRDLSEGHRFAKNLGLESGTRGNKSLLVGSEVSLNSKVEENPGVWLGDLILQ